MIGIIGAMDMEVNGLKERMQNTEVETIGTIDFYKGTIQGIPCVVARSGVGKVNAAICAQIMALVYRPKAIINTGVAGGKIGESGSGKSKTHVSGGSTYRYYCNRRSIYWTI